MLGVMTQAGDRDLGGWIEYQVERRDMTYVEVAAAIGVKTATLWNWRTGKHLPRKAEKRKTEDVLGWARGSIDRIIQGLPPIEVGDHQGGSDVDESRPRGSAAATRAELNDLADRVAALFGETAAEEFLDWAREWRRRLSDSDTERDAL